MNEPYSELREHTLNDIKQVIDFYRLEITDDPETHTTIEGSLAETIAEWVSMDYEQIEITSSSMGDDLIISVMYTNTTDLIDDQFIVVHNEHDMFDNGGKFLSEMLESIDLSDFSWNYDFTIDSMNKLDHTMLQFNEIELEFNENEELEFKDAEPYRLVLQNSPSPLSRGLQDVLDDIDKQVADGDGIVRSKPFIL